MGEMFIYYFISAVINIIYDSLAQTRNLNLLNLFTCKMAKSIDFFVCLFLPSVDLGKKRQMTNHRGPTQPASLIVFEM